MAEINLGISIREDFMVVGYLGNLLVAIDENGNYFATEEDSHLYEIGTVCDADMNLVSVEQLPEDQYDAFKEEFIEVRQLYGL